MRCVQRSSPHSQRNSVSSDSKRSEASAIPSLTARKKASFRAISARALISGKGTYAPVERLRGSPSGVATSAWPEPVQRVTSYLRDARAEVRGEEFPEGTPTAKDGARAGGWARGKIVKSLVFDCEGRKVLVLVPGDRRADSGKIARE